MKPAPRALFLSCCLVLSACQPGGQGAPAAPTSAAAPGAEAFSEGSERMWSGLLPCSDCQGVEMRLVLRLQGGKRAYEMVETYLGGKTPNRFETHGQWTETPRLAEGQVLANYTLDPGQHAQAFALQPDGSLQLLDGRGQPLEPAVANRLQRL